MKNRTLATVALVGTLTVGAFAHGVENQGMMNRQGVQNQGMMNGGMMNRKNMSNGKNMQNRGMMNGQGKGVMNGGMMGGQGMGMMRGQGMGMMRGGMMHGMQMFSQLNLNKEQKFQLSILRDEMRLEMRKLMHDGQQMGQMGKFIKGDSFDKNSFKEHMNQKHEKMLNLRANNMEKAFKILTKEQIEELKKNFTNK